MIIRKSAVAVAGALLTVGLVAPVASASTAPVTQVIKVKGVQTSETQHGQSFSFTERLMQNGHRVGSDAVTCRFNFATHKATCTGVLIFRGTGDLFLRAVISENENGAHGTVVGGTGAFTNARGTFVVVSNQSGTIDWFTIRYHV
jgi:hypothetical protein